MEVIQGKTTDKKVVIAQEIAFAKVLAGNNKTLRDRAVKKLRKWLKVRGNSNWAFTEDEFLRIWTGLFYCMWMSDKFLIQEELAESISNLIHCFKNNSESALLFIKCFNKRILMDWEGLDQYRIDKFNMLVRRFLRQTFAYFKNKNWDETLLRKLMGIFFNVVLHRDNSLGFILHFISIYAEELAKVSKGNLPTSTVLILVEPFVKLLARSKDNRIKKEAEDFFIYLMRQTDTGIEFEEKFNAWREQGFPGEGPHCMGSVDITQDEESGGSFENKDDDDDDDEEDMDLGEDDEDENLNSVDQPLDPRAGSVHVYLPQIPINVDGFIALFKKHQNSKHANNKGRKILKSLVQKYEALGRGRFPAKIKKDPILAERPRKKKFSVKSAKTLIQFTQDIDEGPIQTKEFSEITKELEELQNGDVKDYEEKSENLDALSEEMTGEDLEELKDSVKKINNTATSKKQKSLKNNKIVKEKERAAKKKVEISNEVMQDVKENGEPRKKKKNKKLVGKKKKLDGRTNSTEVIVKTKKIQKVNGVANGQQKEKKDFQKATHVNKAGRKRKILSNWQVQELDSSSPEYHTIKTPKVIRLERKINDGFCEENDAEEVEKTLDEKEKKIETSNEEFVPDFWEKAMQKVNKKKGKKSKVFVNPFAKLQNEAKSPGRRISFALDKNMAQENEEYLEEVKNSPRVPFDGSKKPIQSALKSGLAPSPVNPFYRFKKIKF